MPGRRSFLKFAAAAGLAPAVASGQGAAKVVVVGGGFGGATCARTLKQLEPALQVTLVEPNQMYTACPQSSEVLIGERTFAQQQFTYDGVRRAGVQVAQTSVTGADHAGKTVT